jgi:hypothetical protein
MRLVGTAGDGSLLSDIWRGVMSLEKGTVEWFNLTSPLQFAGTACRRAVTPQSACVFFPSRSPMVFLVLAIFRRNECRCANEKRPRLRCIVQFCIYLRRPVVVVVVVNNDGELFAVESCIAHVESARIANDADSKERRTFIVRVETAKRFDRSKQTLFDSMIESNVLFSRSYETSLYM